MQSSADFTLPAAPQVTRKERAGTLNPLITNSFITLFKEDTQFYYYNTICCTGDVPNPPFNLSLDLALLSKVKGYLGDILYTGHQVFSSKYIGDTVRLGHRPPIWIELIDSFKVSDLSKFVQYKSKDLTPEKRLNKVQTYQTFLNLVLKQLLLATDQDITFFDHLPHSFAFPEERRFLKDQNMRMWPVYKTVLRLTESGFLLQIDSSNILMSGEIVFESLSTGLLERLVGMSFFPLYLNPLRPYKIQRIDPTNLIVGMDPSTKEEKLFVPETCALLITDNRKEDLKVTEDVETNQTHP